MWAQAALSLAVALSPVAAAPLSSDARQRCPDTPLGLLLVQVGAAGSTTGSEGAILRYSKRMITVTIRFGPSFCTECILYAAWIFSRLTIRRYR